MNQLTGAMHRRGFLGNLAASAALGVAALHLPTNLFAEQPTPSSDPSFEKWLGRIKGKHKQVYDAPSVNSGFPLAWSRVFLMSNKQLGVPDKDMSVVLVLRHDAIPLAMSDDVWGKYEFGETFNVKDLRTQARVTTNVFWKPKEEFPLPEMSLDKLIESGVLVGVCDMALTVYSMHAGAKMKLEPAAVKKEWVDAILPGVQIVPSGVIAINRAQERGCTYCYAGEG